MIRAIITTVLALMGLFAHAFDFPKDLPTIEALMEQHKTIKKAEDAAALQVATSLGEQTLITKGAEKFNKVRTTLDTKLGNAYSYVLLGSSLAYTGTSLYKLSEEYADFAKNTYRYALRKPMVAWYFTEANLAASREIKNLKNLYLALSASGINVMKASMDEKLNIVMQIRTSIDNIRAIIGDANLWCSMVVMGGFRYDYIWDILNSELTDEIASQIINKWNNS
ncbi:hypothetical protein IX307_001629 [Bacteroides pyogenes]|uniref:hypothetical protein n=1 Tax=Bacteroides pyogenes TaxID=310300 RepID=UPI001BA9185C|nr:hypothetical protein [Bacteroides pyogenes]MBR8739513.1 hypothetical protein [Bacteroides pyogenes]MBR8755337.1 hypothetical protein [Bacteroides pyogenes]MBR8787304.1 hypothetical protein [Bacteroides pyogenes]MBR8792832.1 hypothetical protein [Bacteroides pyogenes]